MLAALAKRSATKLKHKVMLCFTLIEALFCIAALKALPAGDAALMTALSFTRSIVFASVDSTVSGSANNKAPSALKADSCMRASPNEAASVANVHTWGTKFKGNTNAMLDFRLVVAVLPLSVLIPALVLFFLSLLICASRMSSSLAEQLKALSIVSSSSDGGQGVNRRLWYFPAFVCESPPPALDLITFEFCTTPVA